LVDCRRHPDPRSVWPIRVRAGAFGDGTPRRDLFLSPDHAVFVDDALIPIRYLIDDVTIEQVPADEVAVAADRTRRAGDLQVDDLEIAPLSVEQAVPTIQQSDPP